MGGDEKSWQLRYLLVRLGQASLGKSMQVRGDGKSWQLGYLLLGLGQASLGKSVQSERRPEKLLIGLSAVGSWPGKSRQV